MKLTKEQQLIGQVVERAWEDAAFKAELIADPVAAIEKETGETLNLPEGAELQVQDQTDPNKSFLVIPPRPNMEEIELTDEQLEMIAGGDITVTAAVTYCATALIVTGIAGYFSKE
jgi:hypothetical protein